MTGLGVHAMPGVEHCAPPWPAVQVTQASVQARQVGLARPKACTEVAGEVATPEPAPNATPGGPNTMKQRSERQGIMGVLVGHSGPHGNHAAA